MPEVWMDRMKYSRSSISGPMHQDLELQCALEEEWSRQSHHPEEPARSNMQQVAVEAKIGKSVQFGTGLPTEVVSAPAEKAAVHLSPEARKAGGVLGVRKWPTLLQSAEKAWDF